MSNTYNQLCHEINNLVQISKQIVKENMKEREAFKKALHDHFSAEDEHDTDLLTRIRNIETTLDNLGREHNVCKAEGGG